MTIDSCTVPLLFFIGIAVLLALTFAGLVLKRKMSGAGKLFAAIPAPAYPAVLVALAVLIISGVALKANARIVPCSGEGGTSTTAFVAPCLLR